MPKITPFLWFDHQAEEAMNFYMAIFKNSKTLSVSRYPEGAPGPKGQVMAATFTLDGQTFYALNGGPMFKFTEAISFFVTCKTQKEVDYYWEKLLSGGEKSRCGWLKDKFGLSWQIVPDQLGRLLGHRNPQKAAAVMRAMLGMDKLIIGELEAAAGVKPEKPTKTKSQTNSKKNSRVSIQVKTHAKPRAKSRLRVKSKK